MSEHYNASESELEKTQGEFMKTENIESYEKMSAEEKIAYFENLEIEDKSSEIENLQNEIKRLKESGSKSNSEAAEWRRKFRETQDAETRAKEELEEANTKAKEEWEEKFNSLKAENEELKKNAAYEKYVSHYKEMGI